MCSVIWYHLHNLKKRFNRRLHSTCKFSLSVNGGEKLSPFKHIFLFTIPFSFQPSLPNVKWRNPAGNCMFKVNNRNTRTRCEICSKLTIKIPERRQWRHSGIFIVNFEHISHLVLVFLLLTLSR